jgi:hypothetical protein
MLYFSIGEASGLYGQRVDRAGRPAGPHVKVQEFGSRYRAEESGRIAAVPGRLIFSLRETLSEIWMGRPEN